MVCILFPTIHNHSWAIGLQSKHLIENKYRAIAGRKHFKYEVRSQIRSTVFLGILYGLIDTLPTVYFFRHFLRPSNTTPISYRLVLNTPPVGYEIWFTLRVLNGRMVRSVYVDICLVSGVICAYVCACVTLALFDVISLSPSLPLGDFEL
jgi:hypothetical protein